MTHLLVRYTWRQLGLDGTTQLLSNPENKPVKRALHSALLSSETAWPAFGRADFFIYLFFLFPLLKPTWVSEWGFDLAAFICQSESVAFKAQSWKEGGGGGDVGQKRGQYRKKKGLETKGRFWAQVRQEASEPHEGQEIKTAALSLSPWKRPTTFKSDIFF